MIWPRAPRYQGPERRRTRRWRPRPLRVLASLLAVAAMAYAAAALWLMREERQLIFQAIGALGDDRPPFPYEQIDLPRADGRRQFAWIMRAEPTAHEVWVLYLHGSPSTIASPVNIAHYELMRGLGLNVLAPESRGFAGLDGQPTEAALLEDARAAYAHLQRLAPRSRIVLYGWSLGAAVAVNLAEQVPAAALILEGAPASILESTRRRYPLFPVHLLMQSRFETIAKIDDIQAPLLFLHSPTDAVVGIEEGRRLFAAAQAAKRFVEIDGGHMEAARVSRDRMRQAIEAFLRDALPAAGPSGSARPEPARGRPAGPGSGARRLPSGS